MDKELKSDLVIEAASKVHEDWCIQELKAFYERAKKEYKGNPGEALRKACYKGETKRNEVFIDVGFMVLNESLSDNIFKDFESFLYLIKLEGIEVSRYTKREVTQEEKQRLGNNYRNGEENILVDFKKLSESSKKENLEAAIGAANVFEEFQKAGISIEEMENNPDILTQIGIAIHLDWLKRNQDNPNEYLKVPYSQLDEWTQQQDITVFKALLSVVKKQPEKYTVAKIEGYELPDYAQEERKYFGAKGLK